MACEAVYIVYVLIYSPQRLSSCRLNICDSHGQQPMFFPQRALRLSRFLWHISKRWYSFINSSYVLQNYFTVTFCIISCIQAAFYLIQADFCPKSSSQSFDSDWSTIQNWYVIVSVANENMSFHAAFKLFHVYICYPNYFITVQGSWA
jgi:hypothetical protein